METWFSQGQIVDVILLLMALEILVLLFWKHHAEQRARLPEFLASLLAGISLLVALRGALVAAPWPYIAGGLLVSLVFHVLALKAFWTRSSCDTLLRRPSSIFETSPQNQKSEGS